MALDYIKAIIFWLLWNFGDGEMFKKVCAKHIAGSSSQWQAEY